MRLFVVLLSTMLAGPISAADVQQQVSRLPGLTLPLDPTIKQMFDKRDAAGGAVINLSLVRAHAPKIAKAGEVAAYAIRFDTVLPRKLLELAIYRTAEIVGSDYELNQHTPMMKMCGYSTEQVAQVATWRTSTLFDEKQVALLGFVEEMSKGGEVSDATYAQLAKSFTPQEIVEIAYTVGTYYGTGLFTKSLKINVETDGRLTVAGKC
jgi:alkylhydroperoxidase family enzyme